MLQLQQIGLYLPQLKYRDGCDKIKGNSWYSREKPTNHSFFLTVHKPSSKSKAWIANICYEVKTRALDFSKSDEYIEIWFFTPKEIFELQTIENVKELAKQMIEWDIN